jgi:hypothetical protein
LRVWFKRNAYATEKALRCVKNLKAQAMLIERIILFNRRKDGVEKQAPILAIGFRYNSGGIEFTGGEFSKYLTICRGGKAIKKSNGLQPPRLQRTISFS